MEDLRNEDVFKTSTEGCKFISICKGLGIEGEGWWWVISVA